MKLVVFTVAIGDTDTVKTPAVVDQDATYVCFSDRPCVAPYEWVPVQTDEKPHLASRRIKLLADHPRLLEADALLWHDASYRLTSDLAWIRHGLKHADAVAMFHPRRTRIEDEAVAIVRYGYLPMAQALAHVARYRAAGFQDQVITSSGLMGRRVSAAMQRFGMLWWEETQLWGGRDQGSVDYAAWATQIRLLHLPGTVRENPYAAWRVREAVAC